MRETKTLNELIKSNFVQTKDSSKYDHSLWLKDDVLYIFKQRGIQYTQLAKVELPKYHNLIGSYGRYDKQYM